MAVLSTITIGIEIGTGTATGIAITTMTTTTATNAEGHTQTSATKGVPPGTREFTVARSTGYPPGEA